MISFDEARSIVMTQAQVLGVEEVDFRFTLGRFLAQTIIARTDSPLFDNSAVDGFGIRLSDVVKASDNSPVRLSASTIIRAGEAGDMEISPGTAARVYTGAPVPKGVDAVVMQENCEIQNGSVILRKAPKQGENIRRRAEEYTLGDEVLREGAGVTPPVIGLLATFGYTTVKVYKKPRLAMIVTGDELVEPGQPLQPGQIYDSNSYSLAAAVKAFGIENCRYIRIKDQQETVQEKLKELLETSDVVMTVGGVSVGDYDFIKDACTSVGVETLFWKVAMKPGKPNYFGVYERSDGNGMTLVFGLPGNPVAALLSFNQLVRPALLKMMGAREVWDRVSSAVLGETIRKKPGRMELVRGYASMENGRYVVRPTVGQDSHMLGGLVHANCVIRFPAEEEIIEEGKEVTIEFFSWR